VSEHDPRPIEARLEAAFDRFNRAAITGMEPTPALFMEALEAEGLRLSLTVTEALDVQPSPIPGTEMPARADPAPAAERRTDRLVPGPSRAQF